MSIALPHFSYYITLHPVIMFMPNQNKETTVLSILKSKSKSAINTTTAMDLQRSHTLLHNFASRHNINIRTHQH